MKYVNLIFGSLPRIMYAHECTIKDLNGQPRSNGYFELTFVEQGEMNVKSARLETDCKIEAGEFFFAPVGVEYEASTKGELKHSCAAFFLEGGHKLTDEREIIFDRSDNTVLVRLESLFVPVRGKLEDSRSHDVMKRIIKECMDFSGDYCNLKCAQLIVELLLSVAYTSRERRDTEAGNRYYCERIKRYLSVNYPNPSLDMNAVAGFMGLHPNYISGIYKNITGKTIMAELKEIRLSEAKRLLGLNKYLVKDVAKMVGFEDYNYFSVVFRREVGVSPGEYYLIP